MGEAAPAAANKSSAPKPAQPLLLGLIGSPIMSSAAPAMHEAAAEALGLRAQYRLIGVAGALNSFDSDAGKARALAARLERRMAVRVCADVAQVLEGAGGAINGTPIGMLPNRESPVPTDLLHAGLWVADAVYTPLWTPL